MALPANLSRFPIAFALAAVGVTAANAQSLNQPNPVDRLSDVVQFGVPRDSKFVFCDGEDCPERSLKHLSLPPPPQPPQVPLSIQQPENFSHAKVHAKKKPAKKTRRKSAIQYECKPINKET